MYTSENIDKYSYLVCKNGQKQAYFLRMWFIKIIQDCSEIFDFKDCPELADYLFNWTSAERFGSEVIERTLEACGYQSVSDEYEESGCCPRCG